MVAGVFVPTSVLGVFTGAVVTGTVFTGVSTGAVLTGTVLTVLTGLAGTVFTGVFAGTVSETGIGAGSAGAGVFGSSAGGCCDSAGDVAGGRATVGVGSSV